MNLLDFPPEIVERIFDGCAFNSCKFRRFMRLRLVSSQFKYFVDDAIYRLGLLDSLTYLYGVGWTTVSYRFESSRAFLLEYLAYRAWMEKNPNTLWGRIRRAAVAVSELVGDTEQAAVKARVKSLFRLSLGSLSFHSLRAFYFSPMRSQLDHSDEELEKDLCVAAVYLGCRSYIEKLISQGRQFCNWGEIKDVSSRVFGEAYGAAVFKGDISMIRLLISSNPNYEQSAPLDSTLQQRTLSRAATLGHKELFDWALDSRPIDLVEPEDGGEDNAFWRHPEYACLWNAMACTRFPENYERAASMFTPESKVFRGRGSLLARLTENAEAGHVDMVQHFLNQVIWPDQEAGACGLSPGYSRYQPLLAAVKSGNPDIVKLLLNHGADPNWCPVVNTTLLIATRFSRLSIAKILLEAGAKVNEGCPPPIVVAVFREDMDMFRLLRQYGAKLDTPETGNWAMAVAQFYELESMVDVLVQEGVERGVILHRCTERSEVYQPQYLFPRNGQTPMVGWTIGRR
ncbi:ankyrin repeat-containing domain protein [Hypoxylon cercidicola]|nr:ankyrin repeat-containing domain protein [Hypoxylon cercidicola]